MSFLNSLDISASALTAQRTRMDIISQNITHAKTTRTEDGTPYRRQQVVFEEQKSFENTLADNKKKLRLKGVKVSEVIKDETPLTPVYDPTHPDADEDGYYYLPNVDLTKETLDLMAATTAYTSSLTAFNATKQMALKALELMK
ncbi:MAG: flagellar basal body rod protein FlgC [Oscillospiraceae bacterium]